MPKFLKIVIAIGSILLIVLFIYIWSPTALIINGIPSKSDLTINGKSISTNKSTKYLFMRKGDVLLDYLSDQGEPVVKVTTLRPLRITRVALQPEGQKNTIRPSRKLIVSSFVSIAEQNTVRAVATDGSVLEYDLANRTEKELYRSGQVIGRVNTSSWSPDREVVYLQFVDSNKLIVKKVALRTKNATELKDISFPLTATSQGPLFFTKELNGKHTLYQSDSWGSSQVKVRELKDRVTDIVLYQEGIAVAYGLAESPTIELITFRGEPVKEFPVSGNVYRLLPSLKQDQVLAIGQESERFSLTVINTLAETSKILPAQAYLSNAIFDRDDSISYVARDDKQLQVRQIKQGKDTVINTIPSTEWDSSTTLIGTFQKLYLYDGVYLTEQ